VRQREIAKQIITGCLNFLFILPKFAGVTETRSETEISRVKDWKQDFQTQRISPSTFYFPSFFLPMKWLISLGRGNSWEILASESEAGDGTIPKICKSPIPQPLLHPELKRFVHDFLHFMGGRLTNRLSLGSSDRFLAFFTGESVEQEIFHINLALDFA
jgi:hypothetical protein